MRLIDADALKARLDYCTKKGMGSTIAWTFKHMVDEQPTVEPQWIPCSESLPEYGKPVLWCNEKGSVFITAITFMNELSWAVGKKHRFCQVIAWMPLPEPYSGYTSGGK